MTQEDKQLLLKDLCAMLPYGIKVWYPNGTGVISTVKGIVDDICYFNENPIYGGFCHIEMVKPYLRPMSSMTEEEKDTFQGFIYPACNNPVSMIDWLNSHHFDYRGLISKGLALEAPEDMYSV